MQTNELIIIIALLSLGIPLITPFIALAEKFKCCGLSRNIVNRYAMISLFVIFIVVAYLLGIRFQSYSLNNVVVILTAVCYLTLISLVFQLKPHKLGLTLGALIMIISLIVTFVCVLGFALDGKSNRIKLSSSLYCEAYQFGFAGNQGGLNISIYHYIGYGLSHRLLNESFLDEIKYPFNNQEGACYYATKNYFKTAQAK